MTYCCFDGTCCYRSSRSGGSVKSSAIHVSMSGFVLTPHPSPLPLTILTPQFLTPLCRACDRAWSLCRCCPKVMPTSALASAEGATPPWGWGWFPAAPQRPAGPWPGTAVWPNTTPSAACTISSTGTRMVVGGGVWESR